jgi:peptide/nickel transport system substrate-binding protein
MTIASFAAAVRPFALAALLTSGFLLAQGTPAASATAIKEDPSLILALSTPPDSFDPYFHNQAPNLAITGQIFDSLTAMDSLRHLMPSLAVSWAPIAANVWEIKLRPGVRFHDGSTFDAEDVIASWARVPTVSGPSSFTVFTKMVTSMTVVDPLTLHMTTDGPFPMLPAYLSQVSIIPAEEKDASTADFNSGKAVIGTGPYRLESGGVGHTLTLTANPHYWGGKPEWDRVEVRFISNDADRITALIAGTVDLINSVPPADVQRLEDNPSLRVSKRVSDRVIFLSVDFDRAQTPFANTEDGTPLADNPFQKLKVRQAISAAINRQAIIDATLYGHGAPTGQMALDDMAGASPSLKPEPFDLVKARKLLVEAGYPNGFVTVLNGPNNRYVRDADVVRSVALMLTGAGISTSAETFPASEFFPRNKTRDFSFVLSGWSTATGEVSYSLKALMGTRDVNAGWGTANFSGYSNPKLDALLSQADHELDPAKRSHLVQQAMEEGMADLGQIPLYFQMNIWASRASIAMTPRRDEQTLLRDVHPVP